MKLSAGKIIVLAKFRLPVGEASFASSAGKMNVPGGKMIVPAGKISFAEIVASSASWKMSFTSWRNDVASFQNEVCQLTKRFRQLAELVFASSPAGRNEFCQLAE